LLHIVPAGDYGYRFRNGRKGVHPFTAWNGELPGTLPMAAGTGEAPSGAVAYESDALPQEYWGTLLVTSWGDHRIERFRLEPRGASFCSIAEPIITGGENFRPVGIALAKDGSLFVSDWVDKSYQLHGKGRVWHIAARDRVTPDRPRDAEKAILSRHRPLRQWAARELAGSVSAAAETQAAKVALLSQIAAGGDDPHVRADALVALVRAGEAADVAPRIATSDRSVEMRALAVRLAVGNVADVAILPKLAQSDEVAEVRAEALRRLTDPSARSLQLAALVDPDPFIRQAARLSLGRSSTLEERLKLAEDDSSATRLAGLKLLRDSGDAKGRGALVKLLADDDPLVRFAAVQWVAEEGLSDFRPQIAAGLASGATTRNLFEAYLAALERLDGVKRGVKEEWSGEQYVLDLVLDPDTPAPVRARALRALRPDHPGLTVEVLAKLLASGDPATQLEAARTLRDRPEPAALAELERLARDELAPKVLRAEAIVGLSADTPGRRELLLSLAEDEDESLRHEALRSLRGAALDDRERCRLATVRKTESDPELVDKLLGVSADSRRPDRHDIQSWVALVGATGDQAAGQRVFFHPRGAACYRCHQVDGRGGTIGPDLSVTPRSLSRERWLESLLAPAKEVSPQYTAWNIVRSDGTTLSGVLLADDPDGARRYGTAEGQIVTAQRSEIAEIHPQAGSIMPDNVCDLLSVGELRDLTAFLHKHP
jgi:putative heme-binding domain-containing protein